MLFRSGFFTSAVESNSDGSPYHSSMLNIDELWSMLFQNEPPKEYTFTPGCIFFVSKERILKNNKQFYETCLKITEERQDAPWEFERMMSYIFI